MKYLVLFASLSLPWMSHAMEKNQPNQFWRQGGRPAKPPQFGKPVQVYSDDSPVITLGSEYTKTYNMLCQKIEQLSSLIKSNNATEEQKIGQLFEIINQNPLATSLLGSLIVKQTSAEIYKKCFLYQITALSEKQKPSTTDYLNKYWRIAIDFLTEEKNRTEISTQMECGKIS